MNIDYIEDFIKVAETKSINNASKLLHISPPALSMRIKQIENYFDCDLFYRTSRGIFLTKNGDIVLDELIEISQTLKKLKLKTNTVNTSKIRMGMLPSFSLYRIKDTKDKLVHANVDVKIENNTQVLLNHLYNGDIDIITGDISSSNSTKLFYETLYREEYMIVFQKNNNLIFNSNVYIEDLLNYKIFLLSPPCDTLAFIKSNFSNMKLNIECKENLESIFASVKTGQGITIIPKSLATRVESMDLVSKKLSDYYREVGLISYNRKTIDRVLNILPESFIV
ncbi:LysR family transcriptional regulator [Mammaliicoccus stepanovicii]|uniref:LysR family transcriptional regulator n=1 Tax=Mammaliicoccus stepanovicii TaxID=643214 RepID=A0A239YGC3_9STAP|nr:LysR family transcriptional regulator [Mammaliicoccus stepanovicii]GGI40711.1 LysR family transcriptional regulator [Mammaliicoccus stepanovicii]SNV57762.1 LysR family transcriptional regulator [Mammaliicoccus stepanovicii]